MSAGSYTIKQAADAAGLTTKTIRFYEQQGLIPPAARTNGAARTGGNRTYKDADVERLRFVRNARLLGLGLGDIRALLAASEGSCPSNDPVYIRTLGGHLERIDESIARLRSLRSAVRSLLARARAGLGGCGDKGCGCMDLQEFRPRSPARPGGRGREAGIGAGANGKDGAS